MERERAPGDVRHLGAGLEESAEDLYDNAPCGYLSCTEHGVIVKVNKTFLDWTGYPRESIIGRRFQELLTTGGRIYYETHYAPLLEMQGSVREIAVEIVRADGERLPALINAMRRGGDDGTPAVIRTTVFDATERRSYELELLHERQRAQESEARARMLAETLQASLIPPEPSQIPGMEVAGAYRPAGAGDVVGGDFYDVFETKRGDWVAVVGDVAGKGVEAARVTAAARYTVRATAMRTSDPYEVLSTVNDALLQTGLERFCTVVYARVSKRADSFEITVCSAGHPYPLLVSASGEVRSFGRPGTLLGVFERPVLEEVSVEMRSGDAVVFYTDGVTEARAEDGRFFGDEGLHRILSSPDGDSAAGLAKRIVDEVLAFQDGLARDDIALLVLRCP